MFNEKLYKMFRKSAIKNITGNIGKIEERDDKIICYVDKNKVNNRKYIWCNGYMINKELSQKFDINKPISYVFNNIKFKKGVSIIGQSDIIVENCHFKGETTISGDGNLEITNSKLDTALNILIKGNNVFLNNTKVMCFNNTFISAVNTLDILNSMIGFGGYISSSLLIGLLNGELNIYNTNIVGENVSISAPLILNVESIVKGTKKVKITSNGFDGLNIESPKIYYSDTLVGKDKITLKAEDIPLTQKRIELVNTLKNMEKK